MIANIGAYSTLSGFYKDVDIHDLEFGLAVGGNVREDGDTTEDEVMPEEEHPESRKKSLAGSVRARSNVTSSSGDWKGVPGEIVRDHQRGHTLTARQQDEKMYYAHCVECGRNIYQIERDGCDPCAVLGRAPSVEEARRRRGQSPAES